MRLVYIAGPYSAPTRAAVERNIDRAEAFAGSVAALGAMPVCPHSLTRNAGVANVRDEQFWLLGTAALLLRCDAVLVLPDSGLSAGTQAEIIHAQANRMPVLRSVDDLEVWLEENS